jgi:carboxyl-terminal processing protease
VSRYDDPSWYEEQNTTPPTQPDNSVQNGHYSPSQSIPNADEDEIYVRPSSSSPSGKSRRRRNIGKTVGQFLAIAAVVVIAFFGGWFAHEFFGYTFDQGNQSRAYSQLIQQAWTIIDQNYVDRKAVNYKTMSYDAINAMVTSLHDTGHTRFLTPQDIQSENQQLSGSYVGIGIYLQQDPKTKQVIITSTIPGSPASKAGFKRGDVIIAVNGTSTVGKDISFISGLIQGKEGTSVAITVQRSGVQQPIIIHVTRATINVPNVVMHYIPQDHVADIQVIQFADGVSGQLKDALTQAKQLGAKKIVLDLRDDPGGYLTEAINTASDFMSSGTVLLEQDSTGQRQTISVTGGAQYTTQQMVVLVNSNTASAAEIVSGSLQDNGRAVIIGQKTFGTGTVLQQFNLADGSAILLGTQEWLTPKGQFIRGNGIQPNIVVTLPQNAIELTPSDENAGNMTEQQILQSGDTQLVAALHYLDTH